MAKSTALQSDTTNLCWSKDNVMAQAVREVSHCFFWFTIFIVFAFQSELPKE